MAFVQRPFTLLAAGVVFAVMFVGAFTIQMGLSAVTPQIWVLPLLAVFTTVLWGWIPRLKAIEDRVGLFLAHSAGLLLAFLYSNDLSRLSETATKVLRLGLSTLWGAFAIGMALVLLKALRKDHAAVRWALVACAAGWMVAYFSGAAGEAGSWVAWLEARLHWSAGTSDMVVLAVRKTLHFSFYGLVAWVGWRTARTGGAPPGTGVWVGAALALMTASFDESRQWFTAGRTGSPWDVALDLAGAATILAISAARARR